VTLFEAPLWIQVLVAAEASAVGWLTWRFAWRGLGWGLAAALAFWFVLGFSASFLISRLEGGGATPVSDLLAGAVIGMARVALIALPLTAAGALLGGLLRRVIRPKPGAA
jgi:hypothetical protein